MPNDELSIQSMNFAVSVVDLVKTNKGNCESIISNQIGRSGTSIREAQYAHGKADFNAKSIFTGVAFQNIIAKELCRSFGFKETGVADQTCLETEFSI